MAGLGLDLGDLGLMQGEGQKVAVVEQLELTPEGGGLEEGEDWIEAWWGGGGRVGQRTPPPLLCAEGLSLEEYRPWD